jgi:hypothetical protein
MLPEWSRTKIQSVPSWMRCSDAAGVTTTILAVVLIYRKFGREAFARSPRVES